MVLPNAEQWSKLQQVSERAWKKEEVASEEEVGEKMDGGIWGDLQDYIPLHLVWEKLPYEELSRLRVVCKAWNRSLLQKLEAKPFFVNFALNSEPLHEPVYLNGLFQYDVASREFSFKHLVKLEVDNGDVAWDSMRPPFAVEGLVFYNLGVGKQGVYNLHTRAWHKVPQPPNTLLGALSVWGMMVDTSERPYNFRLVVGNTMTKTQIYDSRSRSWSMMTSVVFRDGAIALHQFGFYSCMCHDDCIYMNMTIDVGVEIILVYSMKEDRWSELEYPPMLRESYRTTLGVWDGRIFAVIYNVKERSHSVWEVVDAKKHKWAEYASCSENSYYDALDDKLMVLVSFFCDEYLLFCHWRFDLNQLDTNVMFNLRTKKWELMEFPKGSVSP